MPVVYVHPRAFETMIRASIEPFKKECLGHIFGREYKKPRPYFIITDASPLQSVKTKNQEVEATKRSDLRLRDFFSRMPTHARPIGYFHSHTEYGNVAFSAEMSEHDKEDMMREKSKLEFIIAISSRKRGAVPWNQQPEGNIKGSFSGARYNYNLDIHAYIPALEEDAPSAVRIKIVAPRAVEEFNRALKYHT